MENIWIQWKAELPSLYNKSQSRPHSSHIESVQLHGFSDASERAYSGVVYFRVTDSLNHIHISLVMSKTKVSPIKRLSIPQLLWCSNTITSSESCKRNITSPNVKGFYMYYCSELALW